MITAERLAERKRAAWNKYKAKNRVLMREQSRAYRRTEHGKKVTAENHRKYYSKPQNRMRGLCRNARYRSAIYSLLFENALFDLFTENFPTHCLSCLRAFDYELKGRQHRDRGPSLDRLDNNVGYTVANTRVICTRCNEVKSRSTLEELENVARYMREEAEKGLKANE